MCPLSVLCVHGLYMSTVRFHTHTAELARRQYLLSAGQFLCVHCQWCVSTVSIYVHCTLSYTHYLSTTQSMPPLCWPIPVCPLSLVCVHSLYLSTVRFHTHTTLSSTQSMPSLCWSIQVYSCVSTVCICPLFTFTHTLFFTHSQCFHSVGPFMCVRCQCVSVHCLLCVSTVSVVCPLSVYVYCLLSVIHYLISTPSTPSLCCPTFRGHIYVIYMYQT